MTRIEEIPRALTNHVQNFLYRRTKTLRKTKNDNMAQIEEIPRALIVEVASYLPAKDAISFQNSSPRLRQTIGLQIHSTALPNFDVTGGYHDGNHMHRKYVLFGGDAFVHSSILSFVYVDQGWGNKKGTVAVSEICLADHTERRVATSPIADHRPGRCDLHFNPRSGFCYGVCYQVGGGGGHTLSVRNIFVHTIGYKKGQSEPPESEACARGMRRVPAHDEPAKRRLLGRSRVH
mmetsp:Transcript_25702/g.60256  ORF Transcript_25702/g.60256 Transcript_25702/m.60256 type:complete len:234 (+) Transcript_25702:59-760(+)